MKIENQVCTLEQAKRLKELGVAQDSLFYHWLDYDGYKHACVRMEKWNNGRQPDCSAFTVAELGVMLQGCESYTRKSDRNDYWYIYLDKYEHFKTEAETRAALLIYRLERGAITAAEVNYLLQSA